MLSTAMMLRGHLHMPFTQLSEVCCSHIEMLFHNISLKCCRFFEDVDNSLLNGRLAEAYGVNGSFEIQNFTYQNDALTNLIFSNIENTSFGGITVRI